MSSVTGLLGCIAAGMTMGFSGTLLPQIGNLVQDKGSILSELFTFFMFLASLPTVDINTRLLFFSRG